MRTTLDIDKPVLDALKKIQKGQKKTMGQIASSILAEGLKHYEGAEARESVELDWKTSRMGATVDLADKDAVYRILDES